MSIKVENLVKTFEEQTAVNNISFEIGKGAIVGFLGPNGAGKSTTMKMLTSYILPNSGSATICGFDVVKDKMEVRKRVGYLPESNPLYYEMYVKEYLHFVSGIHKLNNITSKVLDVIQQTGLEKEMHKKLGQLSKGYKQRVGLAQAIIHNPEVLILDEPTTGLDPNQLIDIRNLIVELGKEKTVLLSTHIMQEVQAMCNRVIIINDGKIIADDPIAEIQNIAKGSNTIIISWDKPVILSQLESIKDLTSIKQIDEKTWALGTPSPEGLRKQLMHWSIENDLSIMSLKAESKSLEEVFRMLTQK
ncbi:MAG TPA: gliding motility-associated ABC transporter ATP-binding subunit GldA [Edaphocola sp.]|nr:gliding motility-associated ABC transporter ATP-binding subunit GldA [Edaphocola sp.]